MSENATSSIELSLPSKETPENAAAPRPYQRKVRLALTRREAVLVRRAMLRLAADSVARANAGLDKTKTSMSLCRNVYRKTATAIERRDRGQRAKEAKTIRSKPPVLPGQTIEDVPLAELEGLV